MRNFGKLWRGFFSACLWILKGTLLLLVLSYKTVGAIHMGGCCRFHPSCSDYALEALTRLPAHQALWLIVRRLFRCRPGGPQGFDPIPSVGQNSPPSRSVKDSA